MNFVFVLMLVFHGSASLLGLEGPRASHPKLFRSLNLVQRN
jgi:hypothetical protein